MVVLREIDWDELLVGRTVPLSVVEKALQVAVMKEMKTAATKVE